jgi:3-hydroxyisobutyrate dehydrogenase-like beta-hydroxyacid dehydrogenase
MLEHAHQHGVQPCTSAEELAQQVDLVVSAVTASNAHAVAQAVAPHLRAGAFFLDLNSASPATKQHCSDVINAAGGRYVEAGVMTSVPPHGIRTPMLLGGEHAKDLLPHLLAWGCDAQIAADTVGVASAIKMCRSIMIKGLEALVVESYTTARQHGVESQMLATMAETFPTIDWEKQGAYFFSRVVQHGKRRAEEMRESAVTVQETGVAPTMAAAIATKQDWVAGLAAQGVFKDMPAKPVWQDYADRLIALQTDKSRA